MITEKIDNPTEFTPVVIPFSQFFESKHHNDVYSGSESILFKDRNPIFKSLMRIEFEDAIREYLDFPG